MFLFSSNLCTDSENNRIQTAVGHESDSTWQVDVRDQSLKGDTVSFCNLKLSSCCCLCNCDTLCPSRPRKLISTPYWTPVLVGSWTHQVESKRNQNGRQYAILKVLFFPINEGRIIFFFLSAFFSHPFLSSTHTSVKKKYILNLVPVVSIWMYHTQDSWFYFLFQFFF